MAVSNKKKKKEKKQEKNIRYQSHYRRMRNMNLEKAQQKVNTGGAQKSRAQLEAEKKKFDSILELKKKSPAHEFRFGVRSRSGNDSKKSEVG
jgi:hypothetical protein